MTQATSFLRILIPSMLLLAVACGTPHPSEAEVRAKIIGQYCSDSYQLVLTDSTYENVKYSTSPLTARPIRESCGASYSLSYTDGKWIIRFEKDENPQGVNYCNGEQILWTEEEGYLIGEEEVVMKDLMDGEQVSKAACEE